MATHKAPSQRKKQSPRRERTSSSRTRALDMIGALRKFANRELTSLEMKREGFHIDGAVGEIRSRLRKFLRGVERRGAKSRRHSA